jgi:hypothetical protein
MVATRFRRHAHGDQLGGQRGAGTLRSNMLAAATGDTIDVAVLGTITLTSELVIGQDLNIAGPGADNLTVSGNHASRVFHILPAVTVRISGLTIADGLAAGADGAPEGFLCNPPNTPGGPGRGGGILNDGNLTLINSMVRGNRAQGGNGVWGGWCSPKPGGDAEGGGVYNSGSLMLVNCAFYQNDSVAGRGGTNLNLDFAVSGAQGGNARGGGWKRGRQPPP